MTDRRNPPTPAPDSAEQPIPAEGQAAAPVADKAPHAPHDAFFSAVFSIPEIAAAYLRERLPADIVELLADEPPEQIDGGFIGESFQRSRSDLLLRIPLASGGGAYSLLEHKSRSDGGVFDQLSRYQCAAWLRCIADGEAPAAVIPMVVYHGREPWNFPAALAELNERLPAALQPHAQRLNCLFHDLSEGSPLELAQDRNLRACLAALRGAYRSDEFSDADIQEIFRDLRGGGLKDFVAGYVNSVWAAPDERVKAVMQSLFPEQWEEFMESYEQRCVNKGVAQGVALGRAEGISLGKTEGVALGRAEGVALGKAELLADLLRHQFGPLPPAAERRIAQASAAELDTWAIRALDARSLEAVFRGDS